MTRLEADGQLNRKVEVLPDDAGAGERYQSGKAADPRRKSACCLSYAKIVLFDEIVDSDLPDDPYFADDAARLFPGEDAEGACRRHRRTPAAPRNHRDRACQRRDQSRRPGLRQHTDRPDGLHAGRRGEGRGAGARRLRPDAHPGRDRCTRQRHQRPGPERALPGAGRIFAIVTERALQDQGDHRRRSARRWTGCARRCRS